MQDWCVSIRRVVLAGSRVVKTSHLFSILAACYSHYINDTVRNQKQVVFFVFLIVGKKQKSPIQLDLPLNISFPLVGGPSAPHCL